MANAWSGSKSSASNPWTGSGSPKADAWQASAPKATTPHGSSHHNILHNLVADAVNTAKGLPFGIVQTVKHPEQSIKSFGTYYKNTYGQGWGHFYKEFHAHPLQPLLDVLSVPLILAGGAGFAVKGASAAAELGHVADVADLARASQLINEGKFAEGYSAMYRYPGLAKQADRFKAGSPMTTRQVQTPLPGLTLPKAYSANLWRRAMTKGAEGLMEGIGNKLELRSGTTNYFSTKNLGRRMLVKDESKRSAATAGRIYGQARVIRAAKKAGIDPQEVIQKLGDNFERMHIENAHWVPYDKALFKNKTFLAKYEVIAKAKKGEGYATGKVTLGGYSEPQIKEAIKTLGQRVGTTQKANQAWIDHNGRVGIVRKGLGQAAAKDFEGSVDLANAIYRAPLKVWKGMILGMAPRYFVNNMIGNAGMYAAATNPVEFTRGVLGAIKSSYGVHAAARSEARMGTELDRIMALYLPNEWIHENMGFLQHGALGIDQTIGANIKGPLGRARHAKLYGITEKVAYRGPQRASLMGALTTDSDFRNFYRAYKKQGMTGPEAFQAAAKNIVLDPSKQAAFEKRVTDWAGQYYHLNGLEKAVTAVVPFYNWDRHALRFGKEQVLSRPVRSITMAQLGALGDKQAAKELGRVPDFLKGAIPVAGHDSGILGFIFGQNVKGRRKVLLTAGYNPFAAASEDVNALASMVGLGQGTAGESIGGQFNPLVSGAIAGITGQELFSGAKTPPHHGGVLGSALNESIVKLPQVSTIKALLGNAPKQTTKQGKPTLYQKGVRQDLSSILGLNERDFSVSTARAMYKEEHKPPSRGTRKKAKAHVKALF